MEHLEFKTERPITTSDAFIQITIRLLDEIRDLKDQLEIEKWKIKNMMAKMEEMKRAGEEK